MEPALESFLDHIDEQDNTVKLRAPVRNDNEEAVIDGSGMLDMREMARRYQEIVAADVIGAEEPPLMDGTTARNHLLSPIIETSARSGLSPAWIIATVGLSALVLIAATAAVTATLVRRSVLAEMRSPAPQAPAALAQAPEPAAPAPAAAAVKPEPLAAAVLAEAPAPAEPEPAAIKERIEPAPLQKAAKVPAAAPKALALNTPAAPAPKRTPAAPVVSKTAPSKPAPSTKPTSSEARPAAELSAATSTPAKSETLAVTSKPEPEAAPAAKSSESCDEVLCLLEGKGCCGKVPAAPAASAAASEVDSSLPTSLSRPDISAGLAPITGRLSSCGSKHGVTGAVTVKLKLRANGSVAQSSMDKGEAEFKACMTTVLKKARFAETQAGTSISYPVILR